MGENLPGNRPKSERVRASCDRHVHTATLVTHGLSKPAGAFCIERPGFDTQSPIGK